MKNNKFWISICLCLAIASPLIITSSTWIDPVFAQADGTKKAQAEKLNQEGEELADRGDFQSALLKYQQALICRTIFSA